MCFVYYFMLNFLHGITSLIALLHPRSKKSSLYTFWLLTNLKLIKIQFDSRFE